MRLRKWLSYLVTLAMLVAYGAASPVVGATPPENRTAQDPYTLAPDEIYDYAPPIHESLQLVQPDGSLVEARLNPAEVGGQVETLDGYTVLRDDADGWWKYAQANPAGKLVPSARKAGKDLPAGIAKKLGQTKSKWAAPNGGDLRQPMFDAIYATSAPNASVYTAGDNQPKTYRYVVLMVEFQDYKFQPWQTKEYFEEQLTGLGHSPSGSLSDYYYENSYGQFLPLMDVYGPFTSDYNMSWYDYQLPGGHNVGWMVTNDIGPKARDQIQWDQYDNDRVVYGTTTKYRSVDMLVVIQAGPGKEATGLNGQIWSHATTANFSTGQTGPDGLDIRVRACNVTPAVGFNIGVVGHEMGHSIGEPDYYDTSYKSMGTGDWDMMAGGSWLGIDPAGSNPAHHNPVVKVHQGWVQPRVVTDTTMGVELRPRSTAPDLIEIPLGGSGTGGSAGVAADERIYIEFASTHTAAMFDKALPGSGILIWHYDAGGAQNRPARYRLGLEEYDLRDGTQELKLNLNRGEPTDPWVDTPIGMTPLTTPDTNRNTPLTAGGSLATGWSILNISPLGDSMTLDIQKAAEARLTADHPLLLDEPVIAGQGPAVLTAEITNQSDQPLENLPVAFKLRVGASEQTIASTVIPTLEPGATAVAEAEWLTPQPGKFTVRAVPTAAVPVVSESGPIRIFAHDARILVVDDDENYNAEEAFEGVLNALGVPYVLVGRTASLSTLSRYDLVIWSAGQAGRQQGQLNTAEVAALKDYLNAGGKLWMSSPRLAAGLAATGSTPGVDPAMLRDYFGAIYPMSSQDSGGTITGLGSGVGGTGTYAIRPFPGRSIQDYLDPVESTIGTANPLFTWSLGHHLGTEVVGDEAHGSFHVVYFGFSLSQVIEGADRLLLSQQVLDAMGIPSVTFDKATYLMQSAGAVKLTVRVPAAVEPPVVKLTSGRDPEGISVTLEPAGEGLFTGVFNVQKTDSNGNGLKVDDIDTIRAEYGLALGFANVFEKFDHDLPPVVDHDDIFTATDNQNLPVVATVTDDLGVRNVTLTYRVAGTSTYSALQLVQTAPHMFSATIPARAVTTVGVEYYLTARDSKGNVTTHGTAAAPIFITVQPRTLDQ